MFQYGPRLTVVNHCETAQRLEIIRSARPRELLGNHLHIGDVCTKAAKEMETCAKPVLGHRPHNAFPNHPLVSSHTLRRLWPTLARNKWGDYRQLCCWLAASRLNHGGTSC